MAELIEREADVKPQEKPQVNPSGIEEVVADKGYHSNEVIVVCHGRGVDAIIQSQQNADAYLVDVARNNELVPQLIRTRHESGAVFAPDCHSIAFLSDDSGHLEAYVQPFDPETRRLTGARRQISRGGAAIVRWPKPGRELFYLGADDCIYAAKLSGEPKRLFPPEQSIQKIDH